MSLSSSNNVGDLVSAQDYVNTYCLPRSKKYGTWVPIGQIFIFLLKMIVITITQVESVSSLHLATRNHMHLGVEFLRNVVFDWCFGLVINMKKKLSD